jgi:hypothetical protein
MSLKRMHHSYFYILNFTQHPVSWWWWSCWCGETMTLNCSHQWAYCSSPGDIWAWRTMVEWYWQGKPDSSTKALWKSYQQGHLVANQEEMMNFALQSISFILHRVLAHAVKSYDMGFLALLPLQKNVCCRFLLPLKIHHLSRVWTREPWDHQDNCPGFLNMTFQILTVLVLKQRENLNSALTELAPDLSHHVPPWLKMETKASFQNIKSKLRQWIRSKTKK